MDIVTLLLKKGANINANINTNSDNALASASIEGHLNIVQFLLNNGADIGAITEYRMNIKKNGHTDVVSYLSWYSTTFDKVLKFKLSVKN